MKPRQANFLLIAMLFALFTQGTLRAEDATGIWLRDNGAARIRLAPCGIALCGTLIWLREPRKDIYNPDEKDRGKDLVGLRIFSGLTKEDGANVWKGVVYDQEDGRTYNATASVEGSRMTVQGCVTGGVICRSSAWSKVN